MEGPKIGRKPETNGGKYALTDGGKWGRMGAKMKEMLQDEGKNKESCILAGKMKNQREMLEEEPCVPLKPKFRN